MKKPDLNALLEAFARKYDLRFVQREKRYLGLYCGICIDAWKCEGSLYFYFYSPTLQLTPDDILETPKGFPNLAKSAVPVEWVQFRMLSDSELDKQGFLIELSPARLAVISEDDFFSLPELILPDFRAHGASAEPPACSLCGDPAGTHPMYANNVYQFACLPCFRKLHDVIPGGVVDYKIPIRWRQVARTLALWSVGFIVLWSLVQSAGIGIPGPFLLAAPFAGSLFFCRAVGRAAEGMSLSLRLVTIGCILSCILIGNIWGFRAAVVRQWDISWAQAVILYFTKAIPDPQGNEWCYLLGGLVGCWVGFNLLKKQNVVKYQ
jgi:hypothetical protein